METIDAIGEFPIHIKKQGAIHEYIYASHPFDVVGWDGYHFPYTLSIHDFEPITGRVHQPPPVHQTFETDAFVICSFVPRLYDYHPLSIPAPYNHSNIDSDEVLYYVEGDFMSRTGIDRATSACIRRASLTDRTPAPTREASAKQRPKNWPSWSTRSVRSK